MHLNDVSIIVTSISTNKMYLARSYPDDDFNNNGKVELYSVPVYKIYIKNSHNAIKEWTALRFMPYWNDPQKPDPHYKSQGWINAGLKQLTRKHVTFFNPHYSTQNRPSPFEGAIQLRDSFLIHAGPKNLSESGWGAAGCVEIIGDFQNFKIDIQKLSGSKKQNPNDAISELVRLRKLYVQVDYAEPPKIKSNLAGEF